MRIEAAVLRDRSGPFTLEKLELPEPGPGEVLVEVAGVGFCHTDLLPRLPHRWRSELTKADECDECGSAHPERSAAIATATTLLPSSPGS